MRHYWLKVSNKSNGGDNIKAIILKTFVQYYALRSALQKYGGEII